MVTRNEAKVLWYNMIPKIHNFYTSNGLNHTMHKIKSFNDKFYKTYGITITYDRFNKFIEFYHIGVLLMKFNIDNPSDLKTL